MQYGVAHRHESKPKLQNLEKVTLIIVKSYDISVNIILNVAVK